MALAASAGAFALFPAVAQAGAAHNHAAAAATKYSFSTLNDQNDPTFNQLLGINTHNVISGYFAAGHPNKGYLLKAPYGQANYTNENFPGPGWRRSSATTPRRPPSGCGGSASSSPRSLLRVNLGPCSVSKLTCWCRGVVPRCRTGA